MKATLRSREQRPAALGDGTKYSLTGMASAVAKPQFYFKKSKNIQKYQPEMAGFQTPICVKMFK